MNSTWSPKIILIWISRGLKILLDYVACCWSTEQKWRTSKKGKYCYHILADIFLQETLPSVAEDQNIFHYPGSRPRLAGGCWAPWRHSAASLIRSVEVRPRGRGSQPHRTSWPDHTFTSAWSDRISCKIYLLFWPIIISQMLLPHLANSDRILGPCIPGQDDLALIWIAMAS